jgi:hypothetical protein
MHTETQIYCNTNGSENYLAVTWRSWDRALLFVTVSNYTTFYCQLTYVQNVHEDSSKYLLPSSGRIFKYFLTYTNIWNEVTATILHISLMIPLLPRDFTPWLRHYSTQTILNRDTSTTL